MRRAASVLLCLLGLCAAVQGETLVVGDPTADLQSVLDSAKDGDEIELAPGLWTGHWRINRSVVLRGPGATLDGGGVGTVLLVDAPGVVVEGLSVQGSGDDRGGPDTCIYVTTQGSGVVLRGNHLEDCTFGIWVHDARSVQVLDNTVLGRMDIYPARRGNGIHLFNGSDIVVRGNYVRGARDGIFISATDDSLFEDNVVEDQRFGIHYMFAQRNTLRNNISRNNKSGFAIMESNDLLVEDNRAEGSKEHGILFRDAQRCVIRGNQLINNAEGLFFFSSTENEIVGNRIEGNEVGMKVWAGTVDNHIEGNAFIGNRRQVFFVASSDLEVGGLQKGNYWSDYLGWDQDGDGMGDRPYRVDSFTANLVVRYPSAQLLLRSPALELLSLLQGRLPFLKTPTLIDPWPAVEIP